MKGFVKKLMLISSMLILTIVLLTYFFILYFEAVEENQFRTDTKSLFHSSLDNFENTLGIASLKLDLLTAQTEPQIPEHPNDGDKETQGGESGGDNENQDGESDGGGENQDGEGGGGGENQDGEGGGGNENQGGESGGGGESQGGESGGGGENQGGESGGGGGEEREIVSLSIESMEIYIDNVININVGAGFVGAGYIILPSNNVLAEVVFSTNGTTQSLSIVSDLYRGFGEYIMFSRTLSATDSPYFFYGKKTDKDITGYDFLLLVSEISPLATYLNYNFTNCALINRQGVVIDTLYQDSDIASFEKTVFDDEYTSFGKTTYLVNSKGFVSCFEDYSLAVLVSKAFISQQIKDINAKLYIFMIMCCVLMVLFFGAFLVMIRIDKAILGTGQHRIDVDIAGNIKKTDKKLEQKYKKLIGNIGNYIERSFSEDCIVIKTENLQGERTYLNCRRFLKKNSTDYILMANDATDLYNGYLKFRIEHFTDGLTEMNNIQQLEMDFGDSTSERSKKTLGFIIYELGVEKYLELYGVGFYKKLIKALADRLNEIYVWQAKTYYLTDDRFIIMADENVQDVVAKIDSAIEFIISPIKMDDLIIRTVCKAGYIIYSAKDEKLTLSQIISRCELALAYAKNSNKKNNYAYVDSVMRSKQTLSNDDIRQIIISDEISIWFQPQYSLKEQRIVGFEALTRLTGKYSFINPGAFIENVEQSGAMVMLGDYIIDKSMKFASTLSQKNVKISVNVSPLQLLGENFVERFILKLEQYKLEPSQIGIEITETYEMSSIAKAREKLRELQKLGINIGIDDFGEKYSSLRYIKSLPIDFIKIDKGFVDGVENDKHSRAIIEVIIGLAKKLNYYTTVEGVESLSQVTILKELGADLIQGYIISQALDENNARELIATKKNLFN